MWENDPIMADERAARGDLWLCTGLTYADIFSEIKLYWGNSAKNDHWLLNEWWETVGTNYLNSPKDELLDPHVTTMEVQNLAQSNGHGLWCCWLMAVCYWQIIIYSMYVFCHSTCWINVCQLRTKVDSFVLGVQVVSVKALYLGLCLRDLALTWRYVLLYWRWPETSHQQYFLLWALTIEIQMLIHHLWQTEWIQLNVTL